MEKIARFQEIDSLQEWENILRQSSEQKTVIFKHSTTCPVSARAWREVQKFIQNDLSDVLVGMVKVIESRPVSNQIAKDLGVEHQSPQAIVLSDKKVLWHASHGAVTQEQIKDGLNAAAL